MRIDIKTWVATEKAFLAKKVSEMKRAPKLLIIQVGDDPASNSYIKGKMADAAECGIEATLFKTTNKKTIIPFLEQTGDEYDGIILQEPSGLDRVEREKVLNLITPWQDVDGFRKDSAHEPCTPAGIMDIIFNHIFPGYQGLTGYKVAVIGRGELVGKPLVPMLIDKHATVFSCNSGTAPEVLKDIIKTSDIIISATGQKNLITAEMLSKNLTYIIDAGITVNDNGKLCGDWDKKIYDLPNVSVTTVPGGVGLTTRLALMKNVVNAAIHRLSSVDSIPDFM